jgi:hypothetical protein
MIPISNDTDFPGELVTRALAAIAQRGAGKSYLAMLLTEKMHAAGAQIAVLDPTGVWFGLRAAADGKSPGLPIILMGGAHGDTPLESTAGEVVARFVAESGRSVILDMSDFSIAEMKRFATAFAESLFQMKARQKSPLHLMIDEADTFAPQRSDAGTARMLGAFDKLVRQGRSRGLGMTLISQRPAVLNKNVLSQVDLLLCGRVTGRQDHKALEEWTALFGTKEESKQFLDGVPQLETGEFWIWSPSWLRTFRKIKVGKRWTFDSSKTPDVADEHTAVPQLAPVDLAALTAEIAGSVERAKENDPRALREKVAKLEKELAARPEPVPIFTPADMEALDKLRAAVVAAGAKCIEILAPMRKELEQLVGAKAPEILRILPNPEKWAPEILDRLPTVGPGGMPPAMRDGVFGKMPADTSARAAARERLLPDGEKLERCDKALLTVLAQNYPNPCTARKVALCSRYSVASSSFANSLGKLRRLELITGTKDSLRATVQGCAALGPFERLPEGRDAIFYWSQNLPDKCSREILLALLKEGPLPKQTLAGRVAYSVTSSSFANALGNLRTRELITRGEPVSLVLP